MIVWDELDQHHRKQCSLAVPFTLAVPSLWMYPMGAIQGWVKVLLSCSRQQTEARFNSSRVPAPAAKRFEQRGTGQPRQHRPQRPFRRPRRQRRPRRTCERLTAEILGR
jgi:hypothetical protein